MWRWSRKHCWHNLHVITQQLPTSTGGKSCERNVKRSLFQTDFLFFFSLFSLVLAFSVCFSVLACWQWCNVDVMCIVSDTELKRWCGCTSTSLTLCFALRSLGHNEASEVHVSGRLAKKLLETENKTGPDGVSSSALKSCTGQRCGILNCLFHLLEMVPIVEKLGELGACPAH